MALVRCPTHKIPYNDENPRGCPACAREKAGGGEAVIMRELARATKRREERDGAGTIKRDGAPVLDRTPPGGPTPVTAQPRTPVVETSRIMEFLWQLGRPRTILVGAALVAVLGLFVLFTSGPQFVAQPHPVPYQGEVRPLPIEPNTPVTTVFAMLGTQPPEAHPTAPSLARYSYGSDLVVDALNGRVYALTFRVPNRTWAGLRIGMSPQNAQGALALLANPEEDGVQAGSPPITREGYTVYDSLDARPVQTLRAAVRPPNGCYDVIVELRPRVTGILVDGDARYAVIGPVGTQADWTVTQIQVVSRAVRGPYAPQQAC